ncbi:MAG: hypothetical protein OWR52_04110 [Acidibacillus sp.]|nr:hypothetical protein [Acidibacillus sp.]
MIPCMGDLLLFAADYHNGILDSAEDALVDVGERIEHPRANRSFVHIGIVISDTQYAQEDGTAHISLLSNILPTQRVYVKRLALTEEQRFRVPMAAKQYLGEKYDWGLDVSLGVRYLSNGIFRGIEDITHGFIRLPQSHFAYASHDSLICSTFVRKVLVEAHYPVKKRYPSPEYFALLPGDMEPMTLPIASSTI